MLGSPPQEFGLVGIQCGIHTVSGTLVEHLYFRIEESCDFHDGITLICTEPILVAGPVLSYEKQSTHDVIHMSEVSSLCPRETTVRGLSLLELARKDPEHGGVVA